ADERREPQKADARVRPEDDFLVERFDLTVIDEHDDLVPRERVDRLRELGVGIDGSGLFESVAFSVRSESVGWTRPRNVSGLRWLYSSTSCRTRWRMRSRTVIRSADTCKVRSRSGSPVADWSWIVRVAANRHPRASQLSASPPAGIRGEGPGMP